MQHWDVDLDLDLKSGSRNKGCAAMNLDPVLC